MLRVLLFSLVLPVCASAQPAPTVVTTLITTDTGATSVCVGSTSKVTATGCAGGVKSGNIAIAGVADNTGLTITTTTTARPAISLSNASTGLLSFIQATNTKDLYLFANGSSSYVAGLFASGGMSIGDTTDPGDNNLRVAGTSKLVGNVTMDGNTTNTGTLTVGTGALGSLTVGDQWLIESGSTFGRANILGGAFGAGAIPGGSVAVGNNTTGNGAAGSLVLFQRDDIGNYLWTDAAGLLRIGSAPPLQNGTPSDTSGTVVGDQTSTLDTKRVLGAGVTPSEALAVMLRTPTVSFAYRGGSYSGTVFNGIVTDWSPEFGMDPDAAHPNGRSFNPVNALGYTVQAIKALQAEIDALKAEIQMLRQ